MMNTENYTNRWKRHLDSDSDTNNVTPLKKPKKLQKLTAERNAVLAEQLHDDRQEWGQIVAKVETDNNSSEDEEEELVSKKSGQISELASKNSSQPSSSTVAFKMLEKMGYEKGKGLGTNLAGRTEPVPLSTQRGRMGLGHQGAKELAINFDLKWDEVTLERDVDENEKVEWIDLTENSMPDSNTLMDWIKIAPKKLTIHDECQFCSEKTLTSMLEAKSIFDYLPDRQLREARTRANPYETIGGAFFQNRHVINMAE